MNTPPKIITDPQFIADLRVAHRATKNKMRLYGRNPNRKQHYPETDHQRRLYWDGTTPRPTIRKSRYQQDFPRHLSTHFAFYGNRTILDTVAAIYKSRGINVFVSV